MEGGDGKMGQARLCRLCRLRLLGDEKGWWSKDACAVLCCAAYL